MGLNANAGQSTLPDKLVRQINNQECHSGRKSEISKQVKCGRSRDQLKKPIKVKPRKFRSMRAKV